MTIISTNYTTQPGPYGTIQIVESGRCTHDEAAGITGYATRRYEMVALPNTSGAVLKSLDGTVPRIVYVSPTSGRGYFCVKVEALVRPLAPVQTAGPYVGKSILRFEITWQQVGGVA
jgi:hypothetical protein